MNAGWVRISSADKFPQAADRSDSRRAASRDSPTDIPPNEVESKTMPSCFQLMRNGAAVPLNQIDEEMCRHFEVACHPVRYFEGWYDTIGFLLATGKTFDQIRVTYADEPILVKIVDWLKANFESNSWHELKSHPRDP